MIISLILTVVAITAGTILTYTYDRETTLASRLCAGACIGFAVMGLASFIFASLVGLNEFCLVLTILVLSLPFLLLRRDKTRIAFNDDVNRATKAISRAIAKPDRWDFIYFFFYAFTIVLMWLAFSRACIETPDSLSTGVTNNYGDLPFHLSVITRFAFGQNFPPEDPTYAGARFTYPFLTDFVSAMFVRAGASLSDSMFIENFVIAIAMVGVLHRFGLQLLRNRTAALLTPALVILNGGFGWTMLFSDVAKSDGGIFQVLKHLPHAYTIIIDSVRGWRWGNSITTLLIPQRGFLLGIPLAVMALTQLWIVLRGREEGRDNSESKKAKGKKGDHARSHVSERSSDENELTLAGSTLFPFSSFLLPSTHRVIAAGAIAGLLSLIHAHSLMSLMLIAGGLALLSLRRWREWIVFFGVATIVAGPQMLWSMHGSVVSAGSFIGWEFGWDHGSANVFWFWFKNTGLFIPLLLIALLWKKDEYLVSRKLLSFYLPFTLCFIIPNVIRLAPWVWDNIKVIFYWWIGSAPIVAFLLAKLWEGKPWNRVLSVALFVVLTLSGALDIFSTVTQQENLEVWNRPALTFAEMIKQATPPKAMILHAAVHNTPVFLTGRRSLMGYIGHVWTHGIEYGPREIDEKKIYAGIPDAPSLLSKYGVDYVVVGPQERAAMTVNESFFSRFPIIANSGEYRLYKVR